VIFDVQRVGPSTGLPTAPRRRPDLHRAPVPRDTQQILLLPGSVEECFSLSVDAFDVAERFQTPVFVLTDLDLGMNNWMAEPFSYPDRPIDRGKVLARKPWRSWGGSPLQGRRRRRRGLAHAAGTPHPKAPTSRAHGHDENAAYSENSRSSPATWTGSRPVRRAREPLPQPELHGTGRARVGVIAYGSSDPAIRESRTSSAPRPGSRPTT